MDDLRELTSALQSIERTLNSDWKHYPEKKKQWVARLLELLILFLTAQVFLLSVFSTLEARSLLILSIIILPLNILMGGLYFVFVKGDSVDYRKTKPFQEGWWYSNIEKIMSLLLVLSTIFFTIGLIIEAICTI